MVSGRIVGEAGNGRKRRVDAAGIPAQDVEGAVAEPGCDVRRRAPRVRGAAAAGSAGLDDNGPLALLAGLWVGGVAHALQARNLELGHGEPDNAGVGLVRVVQRNL